MGRFDVLAEGTVSSTNTTNTTKNSVDTKHHSDRRSNNSNRHDGNRHHGNRHDGNRHDSNRHDSNRHDINRHDSNRHDINRHDINRHDSNSKNTIINITQEDFPELSSRSVTNQKEKELTLPWTEAIRQQEEKSMSENMINQNDPNYWSGATWIGPMLMRQEKYPTDWYMYIDNAIKGNASSFIVPYREIEYSRDGNNWYASWNETFTEEQLQDLYEEEDSIIRQEQADILEEYRTTEYNKSLKYYDETGVLDDYAIARLERLSYEKYAEQFETVEEVYEEDEVEEVVEHYLEDD